MTDGYAQKSQAVLALAFAVGSWVMMPVVFGAIGWYLARAERIGIEQGLRDPSQKQLADIAYWVSVLNVVMWGLGVCCLIAVYSSVLLGILGAATLAPAAHGI